MPSIEQLQTTIATATVEYNRTADVTPGSVLHELVVKSLANAQLQFSEEIDKLKQGKTIVEALAATGDTYHEAIEKIASNFDTVRNQGQKSSGSLKLTVNVNKTYFFPAGFSFSQPGLGFDYVAAKTYSANDTGEADLLLKQEGGLYYIIFPVEGMALADEANVSNGAKFILSTPGGLPEFVEATAYGNFTNGQSKETDRELIARFKTGMSAKNLLSSVSINAALRDVAPGFQEASVVGIGDPELDRNKHNLFGISMPGMADVYVRTANSVATRTVSLVANKLTSGPNIGRWQLYFGANIVPGFYRIISIVQSRGDFLGTQQLLSTSYGVDTTVIPRANTVPTVKDARFTRYQTCSVLFNYISAAASAVFDVTVEHMPHLAEAQALFLADKTRVPGADYLVKAVVPCNVSLSLKLHRRSATQEVDVAGIRRDIFKYVNGLPIGASLSASNIVNIAHSYNLKQVELPVLLTGTILLPATAGNQTIVIRGTDSLEIPHRPLVGVTSRTTAFFLSYFDSSGKENIGVHLMS